MNSIYIPPLDNAAVNSAETISSSWLLYARPFTVLLYLGLHGNCDGLMKPHFFTGQCPSCIQPAVSYHHRWTKFMIGDDANITFATHFCNLWPCSSCPRRRPAVFCV